MTTTTLSRTVLDSKAVLARMMATENLTVEHVPSAQTAYFDSTSRTLVFPCWKFMSNDLYDMLAGHETGHALFTPAGTQPLVDAIRKVDPRNGSTAAKTFLNIVEDARIERLMKARLPGLRRSFFNAYKELMDHPLFVEQFKHVDKMRLIDRINMHYKFGAWCKVPFTAEELPLVQEVERTKTFDDVIDLSRRIWEMQREQENSEPQEQQEPQQSAGQGDGEGQQGEPQEQQQPGSSTREPQGQRDVDTGEQGESKQDNSDAKGDEQSKSDKPQSGNAAASGNESAKSEGEAQKTERDPTAAQTDNFMQSVSNQFRDTAATYYTPLTLPRFDSRRGVIDFREHVLPALTKYFTNCNGASLLAEWESKSRRDVSIMQQEFLRRMAADAASRTSVADTGTIDVNRLWSYKISDDIFLQNATVRNGQSHGIVVFVDFSGSMSAIMSETIRQMLMLAAWCRRSNIPCDVYGFSDGIGHKWQGCVNGQVSSPWVHRDSETNRATLDEGMRLVHLISTKGLSDRDWRTTAGGLLAVWGARHDYTAMSNSNGQWGSDEQYRQTQRLFALNSTPTTAATAAALDLVEQFKRQNGLQIVHFVTLTDGEASDYVHASGRPTGQKTSWGGDHYDAPVTHAKGSDYASGYELRDPVTGATARCQSRSPSSGLKALLSLLSKRVTGLRSVGISITPKRDFKSLLRYSGLKAEQQDKCLEQSRRDGFLCAEGVHGYTAWFAVPNPRVDETDPFDSLIAGDASKANLKKAFEASLEKAGNNRLLCTRLVDLIAKADSKKAKVTA